MYIPIEYPIAGNMVSLLFYILFHSSQHVSVVDSCGLEQCGQIIDTEMPVGTSMTFATSGWMLGQDFLAGEGGVAAAAPCGVSADLAVCVSDVVAVFLVERVVGNEFESLAPENKTVFQRQADAFEEERVLQTSKMF